MTFKRPGASQVAALILSALVITLATLMIVLAFVVREVSPWSSDLFAGLAAYNVLVGLIFVPRIWRSR